MSFKLASELFGKSSPASGKTIEDDWGHCPLSLSLSLSSSAQESIWFPPPHNSITVSWEQLCSWRCSLARVCLPAVKHRMKYLIRPIGKWCASWRTSYVRLGLRHPHLSIDSALTKAAIDPSIPVAVFQSFKEPHYDDVIVAFGWHSDGIANILTTGHRPKQKANAEYVNNEKCRGETVARHRIPPVSNS